MTERIKRDERFALVIKPLECGAHNCFQQAHASEFSDRCGGYNKRHLKQLPSQKNSSVQQVQRRNRFSVAY